MKTRSFVAAGFVLALCGGSVYIFPSGLPQPADFIWLLWVAAVLLTSAMPPPLRVTRRAGGALLLGLGFLAWVIAVSLANAAIFSDARLILPSLFYIFNVAIFGAVIVQGSRHPEWFLELVSSASLAALIVVAAGLAITLEGGAARQSGGFNNPNQMGYFTLLLGCLFVLTTPVTKLWGGRGLTFFATALAIVGFSASLSVMAAFCTIVVGAVVKGGKLSVLVRIFLMFSLVIVAVERLLALTGIGAHLRETVLHRISLLSHKSENVAESRGYDRIGEFPQYIPFGAGEGGLWRFGHQYQLELHSTWGTLLFSYGVIGFSLFVLILLFVLKGRPIWVWLLILAPSIYGLTHQGLRDTSLWVFLGCLAALGELGHKEGRSGAAAGARLLRSSSVLSKGG